MLPLRRAIVLGAAVALCAAALSACATDDSAAPPVDMDHMMALREQYLADIARMNGITDPPATPALVRWVTPDEWPQAMVDCLEQQGVDVEILGDGGFSYTGDKAVFGPLVWTCQAEYTLDPRLSEPLDDRQVSVLYNYLVNDLTPCVEAKGFEVSDPPSLSTYRESVLSGGEDGAWSPYDGVFQGDVNSTVWNELNRDCPQTAPFEAMYGKPLE